MSVQPGNLSPLSRLLLFRAKFSCDGDLQRIVHKSSIAYKCDSLTLPTYVADRAPLFYRKLDDIIADLKAGYFRSAFRDTLLKLPDAKSFQESHFGEIIAGIFAEEIQGLVRLYSKLSLLTAENSNAYKMDLLLCNPNKKPIEFIFGEVKSSCKSAAEGLPAGHDATCYANLFSSFKKYDEPDLAYDLTAARDNINALPKNVADSIRAALLPHGHRVEKYAGFAVIDVSTMDESEAKVLATRKNNKEFDVELICIEKLKPAINETYEILKGDLK
jgi:Cap4 SAVED domain